MFLRQKDYTNKALMQGRDFRLRIFGQGIIIGALVGMVIVCLRILLERAEDLRHSLYSFLEGEGVGALLSWILVLVLLAWLLGTLVRKEPMAAGSGIPQVKGVILRQLKMNWLRVVVVKFTGVVLAIGAGLSLGSVGPSIQLGGALGQGVSRMLGRLRIEEKYLVTSGAGAGLAAALNAPLGGVIFALEEMHKNFSPAVLMSTMAACLTADGVTQQFFGQKPLFAFHALPVLPFQYYLHLIGLGLVCGFMGVLFNRFLMGTLALYERQKWLPVQMRAVVPLLLTAMLGFVLPEILGSGHQLIEDIKEGHFGLEMLVVLVVGKLLFTLISYGSGIAGGLFLPTLVIGALLGNTYSTSVVHFFQVDGQYANNFVVFAMAAYFTVINKAPISGSIIITEMTGSFQHLLALIIVSMTAYLVGDILKAKNLTDQLLQRVLSKQKKNNLHEQTEQRVIVEAVVALGSQLDGKRVKDICWPPHCLLVTIKRGEYELIPKGDTRILAGDLLLMLVREEQGAPIQEALSVLTSGEPLEGKIL